MIKPSKKSNGERYYATREEVHDLSNQVERVDSQVRKIEGEVASLKPQISAIKSGQDTILASLDTISNQSNWRNQLPVICLMVVLGGLVVNPILTRLGKTEYLAERHDDLYAHAGAKADNAGVLSSLNAYKTHQTMVIDNLIKINQRQHDSINALRLSLAEVRETRWPIEEGMRTREMAIVSNTKLMVLEKEAEKRSNHLGEVTRRSVYNEALVDELRNELNELERNGRTDGN